MNELLLVIGSLLMIFWGTAHLFPTRSVVAGFGALSQDNRQIITMEWVAEGLTLIFLGVVPLTLTLMGKAENQVAGSVVMLCAAMLVVMAGWTAKTGARTSILPMRLCPIIKSLGALILALGIIL